MSTGSRNITRTRYGDESLVLRLLRRWRLRGTETWSFRRWELDHWQVESIMRAHTSGAISIDDARLLLDRHEWRRVR